MPGARILLVDDEPDIIKTTAIALTGEGYEVITAASAEEALDKVRQDNPQLLIIDVMLPKMSGWEAARRLKSDAKYGHIPVILITALAQKCEEELLDKAAADFYLKKPFDLDQLSNKIKELLHERGI